MKTMPLFAAVFAAALCFSACGGEKETVPQKLPEVFTVNAVIRDGELEAGAELSRSPEGWSVKMTSPERLEGVSFEITDFDCLVSCGDLRYPISAETMLASSPLLLTVKALDGCATGSMTGTVSGQSYELTLAEGGTGTLRAGTVNAELSELSEGEKAPEDVSSDAENI